MPPPFPVAYKNAVCRPTRRKLHRKRPTMFKMADIRVSLQRCSLNECRRHSILLAASFLLDGYLLFCSRFLRVPQACGGPCGSAHRCSPWTESEGPDSSGRSHRNKQKIVTISSSCQENTSDVQYKQGPLIRQRPGRVEGPGGLWRPGLRAREI